MQTKIVIRDKFGAAINIGTWDYQITDTADGQVIQNPLPDGAYESEAEIIIAADDGLHAADDYAALRRAAYPSIGDQLDALFKAGAFPPDMAAQLQAVKDKYKKPA